MAQGCRKDVAELAEKSAALVTLREEDINLLCINYVFSALKSRFQTTHYV